jgi:zinc/manganese transport system substrate-binding protein
MHLRRVVALAAAPLAVTIALAGCGSNRTTTSGDRKAAAHVSATVSATGIVNAVGAENEYANVISQIGGRYVKVTAIMSNPNTDPHTFEASPAVAKVVSAANLVVQNGLGYDTFMNKIESASPSSARRVIDVQELRHLPDSTPNPHLWYSPETMPAVAQALVKDLLHPAVPRRLFSGQRGQVRQVPWSLARRYRRVQEAVRRHPRGYDRARG